MPVELIAKIEQKNDGSFKLVDIADLDTGALDVVMQLIAGGGVIAGADASAPAGEIAVQRKTSTGAPTHVATGATLCWNEVDEILYASQGGGTWVTVGVGAIGSYTKAGLPSPDSVHPGRLARVTDNIRGLWRDTGDRWISVLGSADPRDWGADPTGVAAADSAFAQMLADIAALGFGTDTTGPSGLEVKLQGAFRLTKPLYYRGLGLKWKGVGVVGNPANYTYPGFGASLIWDGPTYVSISTATYGSGTITVTTATAHGRTTGDMVTVAEVTQDMSGDIPFLSQAYNGVFAVTVTGTTTFTYTPNMVPVSGGGSQDATAGVGVCGPSMVVVENSQYDRFEDIFFQGKYASQPIDLLYFNHYSDTAEPVGDFYGVQHCRFGAKKWMTPSTLSTPTTRYGLRMGGLDANNDKWHFGTLQFDRVGTAIALDNQQSVWGQIDDIEINYANYGVVTCANTLIRNLLCNNVAYDEVRVSQAAQVLIERWESENLGVLGSGTSGIYLHMMPGSAAHTGAPGTAKVAVLGANWVLPAAYNAANFIQVDSVGSTAYGTGFTRGGLVLKSVHLEYQTNYRPALKVRGNTSALGANVTIEDCTGFTLDDLNIVAAASGYGLDVTARLPGGIVQEHISGGASLRPLAGGAVSVNALGTGHNSSSPANPFVTSSVTATVPTVFAFIRNGQIPNFPDITGITGLGGTWVKVGTVTGAGGIRMSLWCGKGCSGSGALTITFVSGNTNVSYNIVEAANVEPDIPYLVSSVKTSHVGSATPATSISVTPEAPSDPTNAFLVGVNHLQAAENVTPLNSATEVSDDNASSALGIEVNYLTNATVAMGGSWSTTSDQKELVGVELVSNKTNPAYHTRLHKATHATGGDDVLSAVDVPFTPDGSIAATTVQAAIVEVRDEVRAGGYAVLTDGATVATNAALGEVFALSGRGAHTMSNPTSPAVGQRISYIIENLGGYFATSWDTGFVLAGSWTEPPSGRARSIEFAYNGTRWIELGRTGREVRLSSAFEPTDIASVVGWWTVDDLLNLTDGAVVSTWPARAGANLVAVGGNEPTFKTAIQNGLPVVRFDGTNDYLYGANPLVGFKSASILAVFAKGNTTAALRCLGDFNSTGGHGLVFWEASGAPNSDQMQVSYGTGSVQDYNTSGTVGTAFHQWSWVGSNGAQPQLYKDAGAAIPPNLSGVLDLGTGISQASMYAGWHHTTSRYMNGDLAELIVCSAALSDPDRVTLASYLKTRWGTP